MQTGLGDDMLGSRGFDDDLHIRAKAGEKNPFGPRGKPAE